MTYNLKGVAKAQNDKGNQRREIAKLADWVKRAHSKCANDFDKAALLDVFVNRMKELDE